ncbi:SEC10/PgrA surface exclusion domain-containing protein [Lactobacillus sp. AN1001]
MSDEWVQQYLTHGSRDMFVDPKLKEIYIKKLRALGDTPEYLKLTHYEASQKDLDTKVTISPEVPLDNNLILELTRFTAQILNPIRERLSAKPYEINAGSLAIANAVKTQYEKDEFSIWSGNGHDMNGLIKVTNDYLRTPDTCRNDNSLTESYSGGFIIGMKKPLDLNGNEDYSSKGRLDYPETRTVTLANIKAGIFDSLWSMIFSDDTSNWGHTTDLLGTRHKNSTYYQGTSVDALGQVHFNSVNYSPEAALKASPNSKYAQLAQTTYPVYEEVQDPTKETRQKLSDAKQNLSNAKTLLATLQGKQSELAHQVETAKSILDNANANVQTAKTSLDTATKNKEIAEQKLQKAQNDLATAKENLAQATQKLANYNKDSKQKAEILAKAKSNLANAEQKLADTTARLNALKAIQQEKQQAYDLATSKVESLKQQLKDQQARLDALTNAKENLATAQKEYDFAKEKYDSLVEIAKTSSDAVTPVQEKLTGLKEKLAVAKTKLEKAQNHLKVLGYVEEATDKIENNNTVSDSKQNTKTIQDDTQKDEQNNVITTKVSSNNDFTVTTNKNVSPVNVNLTNSSADHKNATENQATDLPQTGEQDNFMGAMLGVILTMLGALGTMATFRKKRS